MAFDIDGFSILDRIRSIVLPDLKEFTSGQIIQVGEKVIEIIESFKVAHHDKIPLRATGPLSGGVAIPVNDFELARYLFLIDDSAMQKVIKAAKNVPVMMAYVATLASDYDLLDADILKSMQKYVDTSIQNKEETARLTNQELVPLVDRLGTQVKKRSREQSDRRTGKTKLTESKKSQVVREYEAAPVTYGMVKNLANKFDVSVATISRIVNKK